MTNLEQKQEDRQPVHLSAGAGIAIVGLWLALALLGAAGILAYYLSGNKDDGSTAALVLAICGVAGFMSTVAILGKNLSF